MKLLPVVLLTVGCLAGQAVPVCSAVSEDDARTLLGPSAKRTNDPSGCEWAEAGHKKQLNVVRIGVASMFERARAASAAKGTVQPENGLGGTAFSTIPSADHGGRAALYLLKGDGVLVVDISGFPAGGAEERLPQMRDLARKLVPKL
jgi:catechol 2,3-dioxygenase-like lactoylglutathione lyase family enzyme